MYLKSKNLFKTQKVIDISQSIQNIKYNMYLRLKDIPKT